MRLNLTPKRSDDVMILVAVGCVSLTAVSRLPAGALSMRVSEEHKGEIIHLREQRGWSQSRLADHLEISDLAVSFHLLVSATGRFDRVPSAVSLAPRQRRIVWRGARSVMSFARETSASWLSKPKG